MIVKNEISKTKTITMYQLILLIESFLLILMSVSGAESLMEERKKPVYLEGHVGSYIVFNCPIEFPQDNPIPYILHWYRGDKTVFSWYDGVLSASEQFVGRIHLVDHMQHYGQASINLTAIRESDNGWYECRVLFPNRTPNQRSNGTWFHLAVDGGALLKIPPINQTVMEGENAFFQCVVKNPDTMTVVWYKDDQNLLDFHDLSHRSYTGPDGSLTISTTLMSDLGEYACKVRNLMGEEQTAGAYLNVQYKAKVIYAPQEIHLPFGKSAVLDCHFRSNPPLTNLRWEKDGFLFDPYNVQGVFYKRNGSLFFNKVDDLHAGRYSCTPYNELGTEGPSPIINVVVQRPPRFTLRPKEIYIHKLGDFAEMSCDAIDRDGRHRPLISWSRKDGIGLPLGRYTLDGGNITIENIVESDRGIYSCMATNEAATIVSDTELMIENIAPRAPYNLSANSTDTAITLRWVAGYLRPSLEYTVWYRLSDATEWRTMRVIPKHEMETTITHLDAAREYEFMVLCQDIYGDGMFSKTFRYYTKPKEFKDAQELRDPIVPFSQIGPPRNVTVYLEKDGSYLVKWDAPEYGLDTLRFYVVRWWLQPQHALYGSAETSENQYIVRNLDEDELYRFQVYSLSTTDYEAGSNEFELFVEPYRRMRAITIGGTAAVLVLLAAIGIFIYTKRNCTKPFTEVESEKMNP